MIVNKKERAAQTNRPMVRGTEWKNRYDLPKYVSGILKKTLAVFSSEIKKGRLWHKPPLEKK
jgi:hypothetical protein